MRAGEDKDAVQNQSGYCEPEIAAHPELLRRDSVRRALPARGRPTHLGRAQQVKGQAQTTPPELSGDFNGDISVECWIPRTGPVTNGTTDDSDSQVLVEDQDMTSTACQPFEALR
jgi:hypothetical protein